MFKQDPLLAAARLVLMLLIAFLAISAAVLALASPAALIGKATIIAELASEGRSVPMKFFPVLSIVLLAIAALLSAAVYFLVLLRRIVLSVGEGDPFIPANADRLSRMGWIVLGGQIAVLPIGGMIAWIASLIEDLDSLHADSGMGLDFGSILLTLILFILARVFRKGAEMREDLEGTV